MKNFLLLSKEQWQNKRKFHLKLVREEKAENSRRISYFETYPNMVTLLGIDRMNAIRIPWQRPFPKSWMTKYRLRYEVISLIDFGHSSHKLYHGLVNFSHDSIIFVIFQIKRIKNKQTMYLKVIITHG